MSFSSFLFTVVRAVPLLFSYVLARTFPLCLLPPRHRGCSPTPMSLNEKEISMKQHFRHVVFAIPLASLLAVPPLVLAHDPYESQHVQTHEYLNAEHQAGHEQLEAQHEAAHQYPMTRREHRRLHRA